jgi:hypothetical protein
VKNDYRTEYEAWALNGLEEPLKKKLGNEAVRFVMKSKIENNNTTNIYVEILKKLKTLILSPPPKFLCPNLSRFKIFCHS